MNENLYELLGAQPGCDPATLRAKYRVLCQKHHPDKGGDEAHFKKIQHAYSVLKDADKRARYDKTGEYDDNQAADDPALRMVVEAFAKAIDAQLRGINENSGPMLGVMMEAINDTDIIKTVRGAFEKRCKDLRAAIEVNGRQRTHLINMRDRVARKGDGDNLFNSLIEQRIDFADNEKTSLTDELECRERAIEMINLYEDTKAKERHGTYRSAGTSSMLGGYVSWP